MGSRHQHSWSQTRHIVGSADGPSANPTSDAFVASCLGVEFPIRSHQRLESNRGIERKSSPTSPMALRIRAMPRIPVGISGHRTAGHVADRVCTCDSSGSPGDRKGWTERQTRRSIPGQPFHPSAEVVGAPTHRTTLRPAKPQRRGKLVIRDAPPNR